MRIIRSFAPLRMSFSGGGTDMPPYCIDHGGQVFSTTIDKFVHITGVFNDSAMIKIHAYDLNQEAEFPVGEYNYNGFFDLFKAVLKHFQINSGCELFIYSDLPAGSGMGTSSSLVVALIALFATYTDQSLDRYQIAELACSIERKELVQTGGYQDQYAATFGGFNFITFKEKVTVFPIKINPAMIHELNARLLLCFTGKTHISAEIQQQTLANYGKVSFQEGMAQLKIYAEQLRDILVREKLRELHKFGEILHKAWIAKQQLSDKISTDNADHLYLDSLQNGAIGGKLLGAGGGGFLLLFIDPQKRMHLKRRLTEMHGEIIDFRLDSLGVTSWIVE